jgi:hypothetical protein
VTVRKQLRVSLARFPRPSGPAMRLLRNWSLMLTPPRQVTKDQGSGQGYGALLLWEGSAVKWGRAETVPSWRGNLLNQLLNQLLGPWRGLVIAAT